MKVKLMNPAYGVSRGQPLMVTVVSAGEEVW